MFQYSKLSRALLFFGSACSCLIVGSIRMNGPWIADALTFGLGILTVLFGFFLLLEW
jgi:hypothetical protein